MTTLYLRNLRCCLGFLIKNAYDGYYEIGGSKICRFKINYFKSIKIIYLFSIMQEHTITI